MKQRWSKTQKETAKDCLAAVSNDSASDSVIAERSASDSKITERNKINVSGSVITARSASNSVIAKRSNDSACDSVIAQRSASDSDSAIIPSFSNDSKHARSSKPAQGSSVTVLGETADESSATTAFIGISGEKSASGLGTANRNSVASVNKAITARQACTTWEITVYLVMTSALLVSCATEVRGDISGSNNYRDCAGTSANTEQGGISRNGMSGKFRAFQVHSDEIQYQRSVKLGKWRARNTGQNRGVRGVDESAVDSMHAVHDRVGSKGNVDHTSGNRQAAVENEGLDGADSSYRARECEDEERAHAVGTTIEAVLNKMQQWFSDNLQAEASRTSAAQVAQEDILQKINTALDSNSKGVTELEETQQREIRKMETRIMKQQQSMEQYMRDALEMQAGEQTKNCQREQESEQQHVAVLQQLHALEKKSRETKRQENTATTLLDELEVQKHSPPNATATADTDTGTVSATSASCRRKGKCGD